MWVICHFENVFLGVGARRLIRSKHCENSQQQKEKMITQTPLFIFKGHVCFVIRVVWKVEDM
jgi:hypothetical protein